MLFAAGRSTPVVALFALSFLSVLSVAGAAHAQPFPTPLQPPIRFDSHPVSPFIVDSWATSDGVPEETIGDVLQTRDGFLWLGSFSGLTRFDGVEFRRFTMGNTPGVRSNRIHSLIEDRHGTLWIGSESDGVFALRDGVFITPPWNAQLPDQQIWTMTETRDGALWLGTSKGIARVDARGDVTTYTERNGLPAGEVYAITEGRDGVIWIGLWHGGVARLVGDTIHPFRPPGLAGATLIGEIFEDRAGVIWIGTKAERPGQVGGLFRVDGDRTERIAVDLPSVEPAVRAIKQDPRGGLWVATSDGLWHVDGSARYRVDGLSENSVYTLQFDREGSLWVAMHSGGLHRLKRRLAVTYLPEHLSRHTFVPIVGDGADGLWTGSICGGLWHFRNGVFEQYDGRHGLPGYCFWALHRDPNGTLWLGGSRGGVSRIENGHVTAMPRAGPAVNAIIRDRAGALWIGSSEGLKRLVSDDNFESYPLPVPGTIQFLADRGAGGLWVGSSTGLFAFDRGTFTRWSTETGLSHDIVRAVLEDPDGTVWLGTDGGGLNRMKDGHITWYTTANGLFDDVVSRILDDGRGNLWMSGSRGVFRVTRTELAGVADGRAARVSSVWYDTSDGMQSGATAGGGQPAGWQTSDGRLWFPTTSGLVSIDPTAATNTIAPPVAITQIVVDQNTSDPSGDLVLQAGVQNVEIHYAGLSFVAPQKVQFRYRLMGYDEAWVEAGPRRVAYYSYLPPGRYRFEVHARNDAGVWSTAPAALAVRQIPHFYQTIWFATLAVLALILLGISGYRARLRQLLRRNQELEAAVNARTTEVVSQRNELAETHQALVSAHDELEQSHDDLLAVLNQTRLGVGIVDRSGVVQFLNVTAQRALGRDAGEATGRRWQDVMAIPDADRARLEAVMTRPHEERTRVPVRMDRGDGHRYWMEIDVSDDPREPSRRIMYLHDVTELYDLQRLLEGSAQFQGLIGDTTSMRIVYRQIRDVAGVDSTVLLQGETGTGKELVARAIHDRSARRSRPFVAVNCAGLTESILASQLFGHRRGAFTGAIADQVGLFEAASGGTLLLDEIGDIPPVVQANLLRVLQEREILRLGDSQPRKIDVRVLAATHRDLQAEVAAGRFREDLYYRLRVVAVHVPALRDRKDDIPVLVAWFLSQARASQQARVHDVSRAAMDILLAHSWPGNVRELKGVIESAALSATGPVIEVTDLPVELLKPASKAADLPLDVRDDEHVRMALARTRGNRAAAARLLGISRPTLYRRLREIGVDASEAS